MTGNRNKDYKLAEDITGVKHTPGKTVWHHTWKMVDGKCLMQLVPLVSHQMTCPHDGGYKRWKMEHSMIDKRLMIRLDRMCKKTIHIIMTREKSMVGHIKRRKDANLVILGYDSLGNTYYRNRENNSRYFYDYEEDAYIEIARKERGINVY